MSTFEVDKISFGGTINVFDGTPEIVDDMLRELLRQLRADPRGKDLPEDPSEALEVLLRCTALLEAAGDEMPSEEDALRVLWTASLPDYDAERKSFVLTKDDAVAGMRAVFEMFRPLFGAAIAERDLWKDGALACHMVLADIREALGITTEEWNNAQWSALVPRVKALVAQCKAASAPKSDPPTAPYAASDQNALALALAFLDDALKDADLPRINRKALPPLGATGWATAWLGQVTLARLAAARVQPLEVQRRIHVAATELERVLFALFDRAVPMAEEAPQSPKGGRRAAT